MHSPRAWAALQAAEKPVWPVIPRSRRRRGISHCLENTQSEIPRSARNDSLEGFFSSLFTRHSAGPPIPLRAGSTDLSPCAVPNHPGEPGGCSLPLLPRRCQASSSRKAGADWPLPLYITGPNRVHLRYGSRVRLARLRPTDCSASRSLGYLLNEQLTGQAPFSLQDQPGLSWRSMRCLSCMRLRNRGYSQTALISTKLSPPRIRSSDLLRVWANVFFRRALLVLPNVSQMICGGGPRS